MNGWRTRSCFLFKDYETKSAMIAELRVPITVDMVVQEINRYADSEFRYADKSDEVAIENYGARFRPAGRGQAAVSGGAWVIGILTIALSTFRLLVLPVILGIGLAKREQTRRTGICGRPFTRRTAFVRTH